MTCLEWWALYWQGLADGLRRSPVLTNPVATLRLNPHAGRRHHARLHLVRPCSK